MRLGFVQFGNYREAFDRFRAGGGETYYAQRYSVDFIARLAERMDFVGVCAVSGDAIDEAELQPRLHCARAPLVRGRLDEPRICAVLDRWRLSHLVLQAPAIGILSWSLKRRLPTLPIFADSWQISGFRSRLRAFRLVRLLKDPAIRIVANHNIPASLSLRDIGVDAGKIYPWDWPHELRPEAFPPKRLPNRPATIIYVGAMIEGKGPGDCIEAARMMRDMGIEFRMILIGGGPFESRARSMCARLGIDDRVTVAGRKPHDEVVAELSRATLSIVSSHRSYAEGLPMTIYESLATRTPLIVSDHPMFRRFFTNTAGAYMVPEKSPGAIAERAQRLLTSGAEYELASQSTAELWHKIKCDLVLGVLIEAWLEAPDAPQGGLTGCSLPERLAAAEGRY